jgi:DNA polymerase-4
VLPDHGHVLGRGDIEPGCPVIVGFDVKAFGQKLFAAGEAVSATHETRLYHVRFLFAVPLQSFAVRLLPPFTEGSAPTVEWLFLDLNSYFASVEQQERPELRGRPIGIVPLITEHTCCIAASYEAKAYGIKTGINVEEAKQLCPHIQLAEARPKLYVEYHHRIVEAVNSCTPVTNVMSVDEMACRLMGRERALPNATTIAVDIKQALRTVGDTLRCSVGLAPNRYLSKIASDLCKPDGLTVFLLRDLPQALYCLKLSDLVGVGHAMEKRIRNSGITTVEQLCQLSPEQMRGIWHSVLGERLWHWLRGADFHDPEFKRKSLGKQHVLAPKYRTRELAFGVALKLLHISAANLRKLKMWAGGIGSVVEFLKKHPARFGDEGEDVPTWKAHMRIHECRDTVILQQHLTKLWESCPAQEPLQVGVWLFNLVPDELHTLSLFEDDEKRDTISTVVDELNQRYGQNAVYFGGIHSVLDSAPTRISFTSIPDLEDF